MTAEPTTPSSLAALPALPLRPAATTDPGLRERLGGVRALLAISLLLTESVSGGPSLELPSPSAPGLGKWRVEGYSFTGGQWRPGGDHANSVPGSLARQLAAFGSGSGKVDLPGRGWAWAYPLRGVGGLLGHLV